MQQIRIDFDNPGLPQSLGVVEGESQSRIFQAALYKSGAAYTAPAGAVYSIMYRGFGPQNQGWYDTIEDGAGKRAACTVSGNVVTCELARQALRVPGHLTVVLCVSDAKGYMLKSWPIMADVRNDGYEDTGESEMYFNLSGIAGNYLAQLEKAMTDAETTRNNLISTSAQVKKDIDAKAAEALKSIPESYTELDESVKQLKENLEVFTEAESNTIQTNEVFYNGYKQGWKLKSDGTRTGGTDCAIYYWRVKENEIIYVHAEKIHDAVLQFQKSTGDATYGDVNNNLIGSVKSSRFDGFVKVPAGAEYLLISDNYNTTHFSVCAYHSDNNIHPDNNGNIAYNGSFGTRDDHKIRTGAIAVKKGQRITISCGSFKSMVFFWAGSIKDTTTVTYFETEWNNEKERVIDVINDGYFGVKFADAEDTQKIVSRYDFDGSVTLCKAEYNKKAEINLLDLSGMHKHDNAGRVYRTNMLALPTQGIKLKLHIPNGMYVNIGFRNTKGQAYGEWNIKNAIDGYECELSSEYESFQVEIISDQKTNNEVITEFIKKNIIAVETNASIENAMIMDLETNQYINWLRYIGLDSDNLPVRYPTFVHVSDVHGDYTRLDNAYNFAESIDADALINTGDNVVSSGKDGAKYVQEIDKKYNVRALNVLGNHDYYSLPEENVYNENLSYFADRWNYICDSKPYYYYDDEKNKIRFITLNQFEGLNISFSQTEIDWFVNTLKNTPTNYGVIILEHMPGTRHMTGAIDSFTSPTCNVNDWWEVVGQDTLIFDVVDAFIDKKSLAKLYTGTYQSVDVSADFSNVSDGTEFICYVCGHTHYDYIGYVNGKNRQLLLCVTTTSAKISKRFCDGMPRSDYGMSQNSFNVYCIDRKNKQIRIGRVGCNKSNDLSDRKYVFANY